MGIGDAFLGAQLLADALEAGLNDSTRLDEALMLYESELRRRTRDVFDYTIKSAELRDPLPQMGFFSAVGQDKDATRQMMNVLVGTESFRSLFNSETISRLTAQHAVYLSTL
jgi:hypothetical protein